MREKTLSFPVELVPEYGPQMAFFLCKSVEFSLCLYLYPGIQGQEDEDIILSVSDEMSKSLAFDSRTRGQRFESGDSPAFLVVPYESIMPDDETFFDTVGDHTIEIECQNVSLGPKQGRILPWNIGMF
jgi:hypothetical protein